MTLERFRRQVGVSHASARGNFLQAKREISDQGYLQGQGNACWFRLPWQLLDPNQRYSGVPMQSMEIPDAMAVLRATCQALNDSRTKLAAATGTNVSDH